MSTAVTTDPLRAAISECGFLEPIRPEAHERALWADFDLAILVEHRCFHEADPLQWDDTTRRYWLRRCLLPTESQIHPNAWKEFLQFWIVQGSERIGIVAVRRPQWLTSRLFIGSVYVRPAFRGQQIGELLLDWLEQVAIKQGLAGIQLETDWLWRPAVTYYMQHQFWLHHWKHALVLVREPALPSYRFLLHDSLAMFQLSHTRPQAVLYAERTQRQIRWEESPFLRLPEQERLRTLAMNTFSLHLALESWPLERGLLAPHSATRSSETLHPEGLATHIRWWEESAATMR